MKALVESAKLCDKSRRLMCMRNEPVQAKTDNLFPHAYNEVRLSGNTMFKLLSDVNLLKQRSRFVRLFRAEMDCAMTEKLFRWFSLRFKVFRRGVLRKRLSGRSVNELLSSDREVRLSRSWKTELLSFDMRQIEGLKVMQVPENQPVNQL